MTGFFLCTASLLFADNEMSSTVVQEGGEFPFEMLRDPFWPVGYYPPDWQSADMNEDVSALPGSNWDVPTKLIRVTGTSRMGNQTAAIINGEVKSIGDLVEIRYEGQVYQWTLKDVKPSGKVSLERHGVVAASAAGQ